jgi:hypothetical protein
VSLCYEFLQLAASGMGTVGGIGARSLALRMINVRSHRPAAVDTRIVCTSAIASHIVALAS